MSTPISQANTAITVSSSLFVDLTLSNVTYYLSDAYTALTVDGNSYTNLGALLSVGSITSDYKATQGTITISLSGIPNTDNFTNILMTEKIKGGEVEVRRVFFDPDTMEPSANGSYLRFKGIVSNFGIEEETAIIDGVATNTLLLECASTYAILQKKISGQRTNGSDRRRFETGDQSFDQVKNILRLPEFG